MWYICKTAFLSKKSDEKRTSNLCCFMNENLKGNVSEIQMILQRRNETGIVLELKFKERPANMFVQCSHKLCLIGLNSRCLLTWKVLSQ